MHMSHGLYLVFGCLFLPVPGLCQPGAPPSVADVEALLKGKVGLSRIAAVVNGGGVNFAANAAAIKRRYVTAVNGTVMVAVSNGAEEYASRKPGVQEHKSEPVKPKPPEAMKAAEPKLGMRQGTASQPQRSDDGAEMVSVPAGEFWMGSEENDAYAAEKPRRRVYLDAFRIDKYEVTNALYRRFIDARAYRTPSYWNDSNWNQPNQPVVGVSWDDANAYCIWAGKRLATEAEWEKAARGTDGRKYPWGEQWDANRTNSGESKLGKTVPVGSYSGGVSPYGAHDMASNVWEWVADWYDANYYLSAPSRNPRGPDSGQLRVRRGGSWYDIPRNMRTSTRSSYGPDVPSSGLGFRCAHR